MASLAVPAIQSLLPSEDKKPIWVYLVRQVTSQATGTPDVVILDTRAVGRAELSGQRPKGLKKCFAGKFGQVTGQATVRAGFKDMLGNRQYSPVNPDTVVYDLVQLAEWFEVVVK